MLITANPEVAVHAEAAGVDRIFIDTETRGKAERQGYIDSHRATHSLADVPAVVAALRHSEVMVRINPPHPETAAEVEAALAAGAHRLMLPMFTRTDEVAALLAQVRGRVPVTFLTETPAALVRLPAWLPLLGAGDAVHFGLNDLRIGLRLDHLFETLAGGLLEAAAAACRGAGVTFGIGGLGRIGQGEIPPDWLLGEHVRMGSEWAILSRAFHGGAEDLAELRDRIDLAAEVAALRKVETFYRQAPEATLADNQRRLVRWIFSVAGQSADTIADGDRSCQ